jgi:hypothetical protein
MRRTWVSVAAVAIVFSFFIGAPAAADAQFRLPKLPKKSDIPRFDRLPSLDDLLGRAPLTSSLDDAVTEVAFLDRFDPKSAPAMLELPFGLDDGVTLVPGVWGGMIQSYCLKAGTLAPTRGHGYLYAPLKGPKADIVSAILNRSAQHPDLPQHDIQVLLWGAIARTKVSQMGEGFLGMNIPNQLFGKILDFNFDKWGEAAGALAGDPPRDDFREISQPVVPTDLPRLTAEGAVTTEHAQVLNDLLLELATANAWMQAGIVALDRHGGAVKAGDRVWASKQARALIYLKRGAGQHMLKAAGDLDRLARQSASLGPTRKNGRAIVPTEAWKEAAEGVRMLGEHFAALPAGARPW